MKKLTISTSDSTEVLPTKEATVDGGSATWEVDAMRLPVYSRFVVFLAFSKSAEPSLGFSLTIFFIGLVAQGSSRS